MISDAELAGMARSAGLHLAAAGRSLTTAESCTGGWIAKVLTDISGSSAWFGSGYVTYSNEAKQDMLNVPRETIEQCGAVSEETVRAMAEGALAKSGADYAVAVSGIAGPEGGTEDKPVGLVWFAWARRDDGGADITTRHERFAGDREDVRRRTVAAALHGVILLAGG